MARLHVFRHGEAKARLSEVIRQANGGETVVIANGDLPMVIVKRIDPFEMSACQIGLAAAPRKRGPIVVDLADARTAALIEGVGSARDDSNDAAGIGDGK